MCETEFYAAKWSQQADWLTIRIIAVIFTQLFVHKCF